MDQIRDNVNTLRDSIQRYDFSNTTALDIFTAFYTILSKRVDSSSLTDDKNFQFLLGCVKNVPKDNREWWFERMFKIYEKISGVSDTDPIWLLLQANLIYLAPY